MQNLAKLAAKSSEDLIATIFVVIEDVAPKYEDAKWMFIQRSADMPFLGMNDYTSNPHEQISYYLISKKIK